VDPPVVDQRLNVEENPGPVVRADRESIFPALGCEGEAFPDDARPVGILDLVHEFAFLKADNGVQGAPCRRPGPGIIGIITPVEAPPGSGFFGRQDQKEKTSDEGDEKNSFFWGGGEQPVDPGTHAPLRRNIIQGGNSDILAGLPERRFRHVMRKNIPFFNSFKVIINKPKEAKSQFGGMHTLRFALPPGIDPSFR